MLRKIFFLLLFLPSLNIFSQDLRFGVFVEPQVDWFQVERRTASSDGVLMGINGGLVVNKYFAKNYAFATGLSIGTQGGKLLFSDTTTLITYENEPVTINGQGTVNYRLQYITIPMGLKLKSNQIGYFSFNVVLGFSGQININAKSVNSTIQELDNVPLDKEINLFNMGYYFGAGVDYSITEDTSLTLGFVYHNGFINLMTDKPKVHSRALALRVGVIF